MTGDDTTSSANRLINAHDDTLHDAAAEIHSARESFLSDGFDGYPADTLYSQKDGAYLYWPVRDGARFEGYEEITDGERRVVDRLVDDHDFEYLGCGPARITLACPEPFDDLVVKIGRCGPDTSFAHGRTHILGEWRFSHRYPSARIVPCLHATPNGEFGIYPRADATFADRPPESDDVIDGLQSSVTAVIPDLTREQLGDDPHDMGWYDGEAVYLDYFTPERSSPVGIPDHVDGAEVIEEVDRLRREGEKRDLGPDELELVEADVEPAD